MVTLPIEHPLNVVDPSLVAGILVVLLDFSVYAIVLFFLPLPLLLLPYLPVVLLLEHLPAPDHIQPALLLFPPDVFLLEIDHPIHLLLLHRMPDHHLLPAIG